MNRFLKWVHRKVIGAVSGDIVQFRPQSYWGLSQQDFYAPGIHAVVQPHRDWYPRIICVVWFRDRASGYRTYLERQDFVIMPVDTFEKDHIE